MHAALLPPSSPGPDTMHACSPTSLLFSNCDRRQEVRRGVTGTKGQALTCGFCSGLHGRGLAAASSRATTPETAAWSANDSYNEAPGMVPTWQRVAMLLPSPAAAAAAAAGYDLLLLVRVAAVGVVRRL